MDLARELTALAVEIEWPATPDTVLSLPPVVATPRHARWRRHLVPALVLAAVALVAAFAVPQSRGAILRLLHLRGVTIEFVRRLPPAQKRPLSSGLGATVAPDAARSVLGGALLLPPSATPPLLYSNGNVVSLIFVDRGEPVLLSELNAPGGWFLKKVVAGGTDVETVTVGQEPGVWLSGKPHLYIVPEALPRLAGNVLLWQHGKLALRLEGPKLTRDRAEQLARTLR